VRPRQHAPLAFFDCSVNQSFMAFLGVKPSGSHQPKVELPDDLYAPLDQLMNAIPSALGDGLAVSHTDHLGVELRHEGQ
jgi:hypothetical protein